MSKKKLVLVVDDEPSITDVLEILLSSEGYAVIKAKDGQEGIEKAKRYIPDAMILDVMMPKMSGYLVASLMEKDENLKHIPVILLTATAQIAGHITLEIPAHQKLSKPFKPEKLLGILEDLFKATPSA